MVTSEWLALRPERISASAFRSAVHRGALSWLAIGSLTVCLSACSAFGIKTDAQRAEGLAGLLRFGNEVQTLGDEELERQYRRLLERHEASPSSNTAIQLSLILSRPGARPDELAQALVLLTDARTSEGEYADFSWILYWQVSERYLVATEGTTLSARLGAEQARGALLDAELTEVRATLEAAERQRIALGQQLDALKAIETGITRDAGVQY